jgi:hypothetical protein
MRQPAQSFRPARTGSDDGTDIHTFSPPAYLAGARQQRQNNLTRLDMGPWML